MANLRKAFSKIYDQNIDKIYRFIFLKVNSQEIAQDLSSETFLRTWEKFKQGKGNPIQNPGAFLYRTARNLVIDHYREKGKAQVISADLAPIIDPREDLEEEAILKSDFDMIKTALSELKDDYQDVIVWHYLNDLPISEVSKLLDRSEEATRVLLHRALKSLKVEINKREVKEA